MLRWYEQYPIFQWLSSCTVATTTADKVTTKVETTVGQQTHTSLLLRLGVAKQRLSAQLLWQNMARTKDSSESDEQFHAEMWGKMQIVLPQMTRTRKMLHSTWFEISTAPLQKRLRSKTQSHRGTLVEGDASEWWKEWHYHHLFHNHLRICNHMPIGALPPPWLQVHTRYQ